MLNGLLKLIINKRAQDLLSQSMSFINQLVDSPSREQSLSGKSYPINHLRTLAYLPEESAELVFLLHYIPFLSHELNECSMKDDEGRRTRKMNDDNNDNDDMDNTYDLPSLSSLSLSPCSL